MGDSISGNDGAGTGQGLGRGISAAHRERAAKRGKFTDSAEFSSADPVRRTVIRARIHGNFTAFVTAETRLAEPESAGRSRTPVCRIRGMRHGRAIPTSLYTSPSGD